MPRALVTGCSSGIGRATAIELTKRGYEVVATARHPETLNDLDVAATLALDVTDEASVTAARDSAGEIDVLVNNAGFGLNGPVERTPLREIRDLFETNVFGTVRMIQTFLPQMRERGRGAVVNVSSIAGRVSAPLNGYYAASKYALEAISESLHYEAGHFGIRVAIVEPGGFATNFQERVQRFGVGEPPYDELDRVWHTAEEKLRSGDRPGPEGVAQTIAEALEADPPKLRWPVGEDAHMVLETRAKLSDEEFEATMREVLQLDW